MTKNELVITRILNAPRDRVFKAWTDPQQVKEWWGPKGFSCSVARIDLRKGGKYVYNMLGHIPGFEGKVFWSGGEFKEIIPGRKIVLTDYFCDEHGTKMSPAEQGQAADFPEESNVTILFEEEGAHKTRLSIIYELPVSQASRDAILKSGMNEGWNSSLDKLQELVE